MRGPALGQPYMPKPRLHALPPTYALPWDKSYKMYPAKEGTSQTPRSTSPLRQRAKAFPFGPSSMGVQASSLKISSGTTIIGGNSPRFQSATTANTFITPSPAAYKHLPSCGPQPLSDRYTAAIVNLHTTENRWQQSEWKMRTASTPGPAFYSPRY